MYRAMVRRRAAALAVTVCVSIAIGAMRVRPKQQLHISEPNGAATSDTHYQELQHLIDELLPGDTHYEALQPAIEKLLASDPHYDNSPTRQDNSPTNTDKTVILTMTLADKTTRRSMRLRPPRTRTSDTHYKEPSSDEALAVESPVVPFPVLVPPTSLSAASARQKRKWSADEDEQLKQIVAEHGSKSWVAIAARLQGRSGQQCWERWFRCLLPRLNKSVWTPEEDAEIWNGVEEGMNWAQIREQYMPSRNDNDIKVRWKSIIRRIRRKSPHRVQEHRRWSASEDEQLKHLVAEHATASGNGNGGKGWVAIAAGMQDRDRKQCCERWRVIVQQARALTDRG